MRNLVLKLVIGPLGLLAGLPLATVAAPRQPAPQPAYRISLDGLGYRPVTARMMLHEGFAHNTLDFIDADHVLVTFSAHKLIPRDADDVEGDQARIVQALVLHLPDGAVVRQAEWRLHDPSRYLWPLTHGRFLLRVRSELFWVDPMRPHKTMHRHSMLDPDGQVEAIQVSPDGSMVLVQTSPRHHIGDDPTERLDHPPIQATFYRVTEGDEPKLKKVASTQVERVIHIPFTSRGFLQPVQEDRQHWGFDFVPFSGGKIELAGLTSTCKPDAAFVSEATFVSTGCRGADDRRLLAGFDLLAQANWVFTTDDPPLWAALSTDSGESGRFAFRNAQETLGLQNEDDTADRHTQIVRVYEFLGGRELLRVNVAPAQRAGLNFDLSPNGLKLAVLQDRSLEIYDLPPLSPENRREQSREDEALRKIQTPAGMNIHIVPDPSGPNP